MHRIDGPGHVNNRWVAEDPATGRPPTEFTAEFNNAIQEEICSFIEWAGLALEKTNNTQLRLALLAKFGSICSISSLPANNRGPIIVAEAGEVWIWSSSAYFTGYRSPLCGRPVDGHTLAPLASEIDATGGLLSKTAYAGLWAYARENNLVVTQAVWDANRGAHYFVDLGGDNFRVPDLRDMFRRYTGTDADTANARALGSRQSAAFQRHRHGFSTAGDGGGISLQALVSSTAPSDGTGVTVFQAGSTNPVASAGGTETRPANTAYAPRLHI